MPRWPRKNNSKELAPEKVKLPLPYWQKPTNWKLHSGLPRFKNQEELLQTAEEYFEYCNTVGEPYTVSGLYLSFGLSRKIITWWKEHNPELWEAFQQCRKIVEYSIEKTLVNPHTKNIVGCIFTLKNHFGWKDVVTQEGEIAQKVTFVMNIGNSSGSKTIQLQTPIPTTPDQKMIEDKKVPDWSEAENVH